MTALTVRGTAFERLVDVLRESGRQVRERQGQAMAQCPAHEDRNPSLSVKRVPGRVLLLCQGGCPTEAVVDALGWRMSDLFDEPSGQQYRYTDRSGNVVRTVYRTPDKRFRQDVREQGQASLFRLPRVVEAVAKGEMVYVCEGEQDCLAVESVGCTATTAPMGASNWHRVDPSPLYGGRVVVVVDRDDPGQRWAQAVRESLAGRVQSLSFRQARTGKDASDHLTAGHSLDDLDPLDLGDEQQPDTAPVRVSDPASVHRGQARMAYRLAQQYGDRLLHVHRLGWFVWDGTRRAEDEQGAASRAVLDVLRCALADSLDDKDLREDVRKCESAAGVAGVLTLAGALEPFAATVADLDADPYLLNTRTGTLDLRTGRLRPHDPRDRLTKVTAAGYDPDSRGTTWEAFLARVLPDEDVRAFLRRYVGLSLYGGVREHVLAILTGTGRNGKSVWYGAVSHALGDYAGTAEPDLFMHREGAHPTGEMDLRGLRLVVVSESDQGRRLAEATVKRLTGGDTIKARRMRQDFVAFTPSHTACLVTNHLPRVPGDDPALWARLRVVPFNVTIPTDEQDRQLGDKLQAEADAILAWAVAGWSEYQRVRLAEPAAVVQATDAYHASSDAVTRFLADCCLVGPHYHAAVTDLWERWQSWRADDGAEDIPKNAFGEALDRRGFTVQRGAQGQRRRRGIGLLAPDEGTEK